MAYTEKKNLKLVIDDLSMLLVQKTPIVVASGETPAITIAPDYELPVTVDTLQTTGGEPTINHYKVIGQDGDWTSSSTPGEWTVQFTVPISLAHPSQALWHGQKSSRKTIPTMNCCRKWTKMYNGCN